ncbi:MAG: oligosaccharide flippase family protein [Myxococcales bacterium]|nr:oligosaccharide flippase family protein [Myxococcales bacterium]
MGTQILLAKLLLAEQFGIYSYVLSWAGIGALFCLLGFDTGAIRFVAAYQAKEQWDLFRGFLSTSKRVVLGLSLVVATLSSLLVWLALPSLS